MAELYRLDLLPSFKPSVEVGSVSSYDRSGGNDDGFSGKYSFLREEKEGLVIADLTGPGVIYRLWTPTPSEDWMEFYFDGESQPRLRVKFREIFLGKQAPFVAPLVGYGVGGFYSYVPLPYQKSCKVLVRAKRVQFYQINFARYAPDTPIDSYSPTPSAEASSDQAKAQAVFGAAGADIAARVAPPGTANKVLRQAVRLEPGRTATLARIDRPGRIVGLRLSPASALATKARDLVLRISFDGSEPSVLCPAGDFFGYAWGKPAMKGLFAGAADDTAYCYFPMPFEREARVELVSERKSGEAVGLAAEVVFNPAPKALGEGYFGAVWRRENPTANGVPFTFVAAQGRGHLVGVVLQSQGLESGKTLFFEGDDQTTLDGRLAIHGTGSEDFFNGGWYDVPDRWEKRLSFPLSGCLAYQKHLGRTGAYRFLVGDAYAFRQSLLQTIEHSGEKNNIPTDYCAVSYLYAADPPRYALAEDRRVADPREVIFPAWWQLPIHAFTFHDASLERRAEKVGGEEVRFLSMTAKGDDWFGQPFFSPTVDLPAEGRYEISIEALKGPGQAMVRLFENEMPVGAPVDLYSPERGRTGRVKLGVLRLEEGQNHLMFKLVGKNASSSGLALDLVQVVCSRVD